MRLRSAAVLLRATQTRLLLSIALLVTAGRTPFAVAGDTWFNLVGGREILEKGLVDRNDLTVDGYGTPVVDQQWLAHCIYVTVFQRCGAGGIVSLAALCTAGAFAACAWFGVARGATPGRTLAVGLLSLSVLIAQTVARAQALSVPLLAACVLLLVQDARRPRRATWAVVPCAALWANLHGSVLLAPVMAGLLVLTRPLDARRRGRAVGVRTLARDAGLALTVLAAAFSSPYASRLPDYYRATLLNPAFAAYVTEWGPATPRKDPQVLLLAGLVLALVTLAGARWLREPAEGRPSEARESPPVFELVLCFALALCALRTVRYGTPLALAAAALIPDRADAALGERLRVDDDRPLRVLTALLAPLAVLAFAAIPWIAGRVLRDQFPAAFTDAVARAAGATGTVLADESQADRLLWFHPELARRVSHDSRMEILPGSFLDDLALAYGQPDARRARVFLASYDVVVVDRDHHRRLLEWFLQDRSWRSVAADPLAMAFERSPG